MISFLMASSRRLEPSFMSMHLWKRTAGFFR
jgi:hypothetical protein